MNRLVVSLGRQFGSGGREVAKKLAEKLEIDYLDKGLLVRALEHGQADPALLCRECEQLLVQSVDLQLFGPFVCHLSAAAAKLPAQ